MNLSPWELVVFNFHDVILLMTAMQCLLFALLLCFTNNNYAMSTFFLAGFLCAHALIPLNELILWGAEFKVLARAQWPNLYFTLGMAYYVDGPLLFLCIKSLVFRDFTIKRFEWLHLLPFLYYCGFIWIAFYSHPIATRLDMLNSEIFVYSDHYVLVELCSKVLRIGYTVACFILLSRYAHRLQDTHSNMEKAHISWLRRLVIGIFVVMLSEALLVVTKTVSFEHEIYSYIGLSGYYASFVLVNLLVFTAVRYFGIFEQVIEEIPVKKSSTEKFLQPEMATKVDNEIRANKIFMDPDLTLDTLADALGIIPRDLSTLINRHFGINFYEFINRYRIEEAKRMLLSADYKTTTITDIYLAVGFNSKSVFYTFFKKLEGVTPSQCRQIAEQTPII